MSRYGRQPPRKARDGGNIWISYSDLMSALLLVFVLVLFFSLFQYWKMYETKTAELAEQELWLTAQTSLLDETEQKLQENQASYLQSLDELDEKEAALLAEREKLSAADRELALQLIRYEQQEKELGDLRAALDIQQQTLQTLESELTTQQRELSDAQASYNMQQQIMEDQQVRINKLIGVRADIVAQVVTSLSQNDISGARIDNDGAIMFDSEMMFAVNSDALSDSGKEYLRRFMPNYLRVLLAPENRSYISQIVIEGHTDRSGTFALNMSLSSNRAKSVLNYILSDEMNITAAMKQQLESIVTVNGRAYNDPIYNMDGTVNMDESRRVMIKFRMNDEQMINEMAELLRGMP